MTRRLARAVVATTLLTTPGHAFSACEVTDVAIGSTYVVAALADGTVWTWGLAAHAANLVAGSTAPRRVPGADPAQE